MAKSEDVTHEKPLPEAQGRQSGLSWDGPAPPGHKTASPDDRMRAMEMAMSFHQGMHNDPQALINTAIAILDFVFDKSPP